MNKNKTNVSIVDNSGIRRKASIVIGGSGSHASGIILDANATEKLIEEKAVNAAEIAVYNAAVSKPFPDSWPTKTTLAALCAAVVADSNATVGQTYTGQVSCSGLPTGMGNGELKIEIIQALSGKLLVLTMVSTNLFPYHWERIYYASKFRGINNGEWRPYMPMQVFDSFLTALGTQMNGTWSYNDETNQFTFTPTVEQPVGE
jgi:hypothetical protein